MQPREAYFSKKFSDAVIFFHFILLFLIFKIEELHFKPVQ